MKTGIHILVIAAALAISAVYCFTLFGGYEGIGDGGDYAGLARSIISGNGFSLGHVYPLALAFRSKIPQPNNMWAPVYPLYLAIWFKFLGANDRAAISASVFAIWLLVLSTYFLARKIAGDTIGLLAAVLVGLSQVVFYAAIEGTPEILAGALLAFSTVFITGQLSLRRIICSGVLFGLAVLARYQIFIVAIPLIIFFFGKKTTYLGGWAVAVILTLSPWLLRNWLVLGNPIFTLQSYGEYTKGMGRFSDFYHTYRSFQPMTLFYALSHFPFDVAKKFVGGLIFFAGSFPIRLNFLGIVPFFYGLMKFDKIDGIQRKAVLMAFASTLLIVALSSIDGHHDRHLVPLQPFLAIAMLLGGVLFARDFGFYKYRAVLIAGIVILFLPTRSPYQEMRLMGVARECRANLSAYDSISRLIGKNEIVISDASDAVWWYAGCNSIWLPVEYDTFKTLISRGDCHYLYLAKPEEFIGRMKNDDLYDFALIAEADTSFSGPGKLYQLSIRSARLEKATT